MSITENSRSPTTNFISAQDSCNKSTLLNTWPSDSLMRQKLIHKVTCIKRQAAFRVLKKKSVWFSCKVGCCHVKGTLLLDSKCVRRGLTLIPPFRKHDSFSAIAALQWTKKHLVSAAVPFRESSFIATWGILNISAALSLLINPVK